MTGPPLETQVAVLAAELLVLAGEQENPDDRLAVGEVEDVIVLVARGPAAENFRAALEADPEA